MPARQNSTMSLADTGSENWPEADPEHTRQADGHVGVPREVVIDLETEGDNGEPRRCRVHGLPCLDHAPSRIGKNGTGVRDKTFLKSPMLNRLNPRPYRTTACPRRILANCGITSGGERSAPQSTAGKTLRTARNSQTKNRALHRDVHQPEKRFSGT